MKQKLICPLNHSTFHFWFGVFFFVHIKSAIFERQKPCNTQKLVTKTLLRKVEPPYNDHFTNYFKITHIRRH